MFSDQWLDLSARSSYLDTDTTTTVTPPPELVMSSNLEGFSKYSKVSPPNLLLPSLLLFFLAFLFAIVVLAINDKRTPNCKHANKMKIQAQIYDGKTI
jgi:hypothetical protein